MKYHVWSVSLSAGKVVNVLCRDIHARVGRCADDGRHNDRKNVSQQCNNHGGETTSLWRRDMKPLDLSVVAAYWERCVPHSILVYLCHMYSFILSVATVLNHCRWRMMLLTWFCFKLVRSCKVLFLRRQNVRP